MWLVRWGRGAGPRNSGRVDSACCRGPGSGEPQQSPGGELRDRVTRVCTVRGEKRAEPRYRFMESLTGEDKPVKVLIQVKISAYM